MLQKVVYHSCFSSSPPTTSPCSFYSSSFTFVVVVQLLSHAQLFETPWTAACQASLSFTVSWSLLKFMSIESVMPYNYLILCLPLFLMPLILPSIRVFSNESALHIRWPEYWAFSISPSSEYSGLITFGIDWFDLLAMIITIINNNSNKT